VKMMVRGSADLLTNRFNCVAGGGMYIRFMKTDRFIPPLDTIDVSID